MHQKIRGEDARAVFISAVVEFTLCILKVMHILSDKLNFTS